MIPRLHAVSYTAGSPVALRSSTPGSGKVHAQLRTIEYTLQLFDRARRWPANVQNTLPGVDDPSLSIFNDADVSSAEVI